MTTKKAKPEVTTEEAPAEVKKPVRRTRVKKTAPPNFPLPNFPDFLSPANLPPLFLGWLLPCGAVAAKSAIQARTQSPESSFVVPRSKSFGSCTAP